MPACLIARKGIKPRAERDGGEEEGRCQWKLEEFTGNVEKQANVGRLDLAREEVDWQRERSRWLEEKGQKSLWDGDGKFKHVSLVGSKERKKNEAQGRKEGGELVAKGCRL